MEGLLAQLDDAILSDNLRAINGIRILESAERDVEKEPSPQLPRREIAPVSEIPEHSHETDRFLKEKQGQQKTNIGRSNNQGGEVAKKSEMRQKSIRRSKVEKKPVASASAGNGVISASANRPSAVPVPKSVRIDPSADFEDGENFGEGWGGQVFKNERSSEDGSFEGDKLSKFEFVESKAEYDPPELPKEVVGGIGDKQKFGSVFGGVSSFPATSARPSERVVSDHKSASSRFVPPSLSGLATKFASFFASSPFTRSAKSLDVRAKPTSVISSSFVSWEANRAKARCTLLARSARSIDPL
jgi:hypothetical protein